MIYIKQFFVTALIFFAVDIFWLGIVAKKLYRHYIGHLMADQVFIGPAVIFYCFFIVGLIYFVINPALLKESFKYAIFTGMFFGFITYATYDLTNLATLKNWPIAITIIDIAWGTSLTGVVSGISYLILKI